MLYPFIFKPIFKERVWGGRQIEKLYGKKLPPGAPIGESWEISDRAGDVSVIANGPLAGGDLHWLMEHHPAELLGAERHHHHRFPLLIKILDAQEKLSLQVHPPAHKAAELRGEPKTEMWYIADATPAAELYVGLKHGVSRADFQNKIQTGGVAGCFHRVPVRRGDAMFLPSGRVHAIGAGLVIFEIQQNSDTTYRVFDWNRVGLDGKPRELHVPESLASIDFEDFEPSLAQSEFEGSGTARSRRLADDPLFKVTLYSTTAVHQPPFLEPQMRIVGVVEGTVRIGGGGETVELAAGRFCLIPASVKDAHLRADAGSSFLLVELGNG